MLFALLSHCSSPFSPSDIIKAGGPVTSPPIACSLRSCLLPSAASYRVPSVKMAIKATLENTIGAMFLGIIGCALYVPIFMESLCLIPISIVFSEPFQSKFSLIIPIFQMTGAVKKSLCVSPFTYHEQVRSNPILFLLSKVGMLMYGSFFLTLLGNTTIEAFATMLVLGDWLWSTSFSPPTTFFLMSSLIGGRRPFMGLLLGKLGYFLAPSLTFRHASFMKDFQGANNSGCMCSVVQNDRKISLSLTCSKSFIAHNHFSRARVRRWFGQPSGKCLLSIFHKSLCMASPNTYVPSLEHTSISNGPFSSQWAKTFLECGHGSW
jgi:hypothetical protein